MIWSCYLYFLACSFTLSKAQGTDEGCITCAVGKFLETGWEDWILPTAAGALQFLGPDLSPAPETIPNEPDKQWTNNSTGTVNESDIEIETIVSADDKKCDPNDAEVSVIPASLTDLQAVVVVSIGTRSFNPAPANVWPAKIARAPGIPVSGVEYYLAHRVAPPGPFITLHAPRYASCKHINDDRRIEGASPAVAILTPLAADMLTRPKVRAKLFIDNPALAPDEQRLMALRPVSAKIRDYLDSLAFDHGLFSVRCVWNGLDPDVMDINQYNA